MFCCRTLVNRILCLATPDTKAVQAHHHWGDCNGQSIYSSLKFSFCWFDNITSGSHIHVEV